MTSDVILCYFKIKCKKLILSVSCVTQIANQMRLCMCPSITYSQLGDFNSFIFSHGFANMIIMIIFKPSIPFHSRQTNRRKRKGPFILHARTFIQHFSHSFHRVLFYFHHYERKSMRFVIKCILLFV